MFGHAAEQAIEVDQHSTAPSPTRVARVGAMWTWAKRRRKASEHAVAEGDLHGSCKAQRLTVAVRFIKKQPFALYWLAPNATWYGLAVVSWGHWLLRTFHKPWSESERRFKGGLKRDWTARLQASVHSPDTVTTEILRDVYELAHRYPNLQHVRIHPVMSASGVIDKYGNDVKGRTSQWGLRLNADDLAEMRKYRERHLYMTNSVRRVYEYKIRHMPMGRLLAQ